MPIRIKPDSQDNLIQYFQFYFYAVGNSGSLKI